MRIRNWVRSAARVAAAPALFALAAGCAVTTLPTSEEGVTAERVVLNRTPLGGGGERTEIFLFRPAGKGPFPGVVLLHGDSPEAAGMEGGKEFYYDGTGEFLASQGYAAMAPSMPGFGGTPGDRDFVGPATLSRLRAAMAHFQALPWVNSDRIAIFGASRGATAAALLARSVPEVRAVILQSGLYDLRGVIEENAKTGGATAGPAKEALALQKRIDREAGKSSEALRSRSPVEFTGQLSCPVLLIHGKEDRAVSIRQMRRFAERLRKEMGDRREVISREVPGGHVVSGALIWSEALPFLKRCLAEPSLAQGGAERPRSSKSDPTRKPGK